VCRALAAGRRGSFDEIEFVPTLAIPSSSVECFTLLLRSVPCFVPCSLLFVFAKVYELLLVFFPRVLTLGSSYYFSLLALSG
jgi:hypothetical protein